MTYSSSLFAQPLAVPGKKLVWAVVPHFPMLNTLPLASIHAFVGFVALRPGIPAMHDRFTKEGTTSFWASFLACVQWVVDHFKLVGRPVDREVIFALQEFRAFLELVQNCGWK